MRWLEWVAVIITGIAAIAACYQSYLTRQQLTAADRNRSFQTVIEDTFSLCAALKRVPMPFVRPSLIIKGFKGIDFKGYFIVEDDLPKNLFEGNDDRLSQVPIAYEKLDTSMQIAELWITDAETLELGQLRSQIARSLDPGYFEIGMHEMDSQFLLALATAREACVPLGRSIQRWMKTGIVEPPSGHAKTILVHKTDVDLLGNLKPEALKLFEGDRG
ncbi:MAG: hypothetical protein AAAC50_09415 [Rhizobium altiplani]|jgi:hypothetical protein|uniref:hypothetical protein n=1 Tax=Rhizobium altiplani TaxID=1864509 RepID=UPI000DD85211